LHTKRQYSIDIEHSGQVNLPENLVERYGLIKGAKILLEEVEGYLILRRSVNVLERIYIEPTNTCNLTCVTCMRNIWQEEPGWMSTQTFERICESIESFAKPPTIFFDGFGEPLAHPNIISMVEKASAHGASVEMITNGILLDESISARLLRAGLHTLWVSLDGTSPESYQDIRLGGYFNQVLNNLQVFHRLRSSENGSDTQLGISFVAMQRNIGDLPGVLHLAGELRAAKVKVTNLLAHTADMHAENLYNQTQDEGRLLPELELARMDLDEATLQLFRKLIHTGVQISISGDTSQPIIRTCPFLEKASMSIRWDGAVSPCPGLMHSHESYLGDRTRRSHAYAVGNINETGLKEIWLQAEYIKLRERLQQFDYSPCVQCNTCEMSEQNLEDCFGNRQPACGGCLWAQGLIDCP
jgi:MoaA/NifB/PqqE/SkfB family radical SAM enzyme